MVNQPQLLPLPADASAVSPPKPKVPDPGVREANEAVRKALKHAGWKVPKRISPALRQFVEDLRRMGAKLPRQYVAPLKPRRPGSKIEIRRRTHDRKELVNGVDAAVSLHALQKLRVVMMKEAFDIITNNDASDDDLAEVFGWIDRDVLHPLCFELCIDAWCRHASTERDEPLDPEWVAYGLRRRRPSWIANPAENPSLFGLYFLARYL